MKYLIEVIETYRVDTEAEVNKLIEEAKANPSYELNKYSRAYKEKKQKGEVVEAWYKVTLNKKICEEKDPSGCISLEYTEG
jgi:hypothetical protein